MQQEKLVLPKFTVPGQRNWMPWALAGVGGLVVVSVIAFSMVVWKNKSAPTAAAAPVPAKVVEPTAAAAPTAVPAAQPRTALAAVATPPADLAKEEAPAARPAKAHRSHHGHGSKSLARAGGSPHARSSGKNDAIDELLKKFK
jgi:hypothetical protein